MVAVRVGMVLVVFMLMGFGLMMSMATVHMLPRFGCMIVVWCCLRNCRKKSQHGKNDKLFHTYFVCLCY